MKKNLLFLFTLVTSVISAQTLDNSFGFNGKTVNVLYAPDISVTGSFLLANNKLIIAGAESDGGYNRQGFLAAFNADGKPALQFGYQGVVTTHFGQVSAFAAKQPLNKIVMASWDPGADGFNQYLLVSRYNSNGSIDSSFGTNGLSYYTAGGLYQYPTCIDVDKTGNIYAGGVFNTPSKNILVVKMMHNGTIDSSFKITGPSTRACQSLLVLNNGSLLAGFSDQATGGSTSVSIAKYNRAGKADHSFANNGILQPDGSTGTTVYMQPADNGSFIVLYYNSTGLVFQKFNADGTPDNSFGDNSIASTQGAMSSTFAIDENGNILQPLHGFSVKRYTSNGAVDLSFGDNGFVTTSFKALRLPDNNNGSFSAIVPQPGGFYATGYYTDGDAIYAVVAAKYKTSPAAAATNNLTVQKNIPGVAKMVLSPNPVHDMLNINNLPAKSHIVIMRADGTVVQSAEATSNSFKLNIGNLSNGIYYLVVKETNQKERFVKL